MSPPDPQTIVGVLGSLAIAVTAYVQRTKASRKRTTWEKDDCERAVAVAFQEFSMQHAEEVSSLQMGIAEMRRRLTVLEYAGERDEYVKDDLKDLKARIRKLERARYTDMPPEANA